MTEISNLDISKNKGECQFLLETTLQRWKSSKGVKNFHQYLKINRSIQISTIGRFLKHQQALVKLKTLSNDTIVGSKKILPKILRHKQHQVLKFKRIHIV